MTLQATSRTVVSVADESGNPVGTGTQAPASDARGIVVRAFLSGTPAVDTELPSAAVLADGTANPTAPAVGTFLHGFDGTDWERLRCDATSRRLEVEVENNPVLGAGTNNIGDIDVLTLPALPTGTNSIGDVRAVTTSVTPGTGAGHLGKAEDAAHTSGDTGVMLLGVRNDAAAALTSANTDYSPLAVDSAGRLLSAYPLNRTASGALGALNNAVTITGDGLGSVEWEIDAGNLVGTVVFEATMDDTNWFGINALLLSDNTIVTSITAFANRGTFTPVGFSQYRVRVSAYTSGSSDARIEAAVGFADTVRLGQSLPAGSAIIGSVSASGDFPTLNYSGTLRDDGTTQRTVQRAFVDPALTGNTEVVAAQGAGVRIRVLGVAITPTLANNVKFQSSLTDISATFRLAANGIFVLPESQHGWFQTAANEALNVNLSAATATGVQVIWMPSA